MEPETLAPASGDERTATEPETLKNYIGGEWVESAATETIDDIDPATGEDPRPGAAVDDGRRRRRRPRRPRRPAGLGGGAGARSGPAPSSRSARRSSATATS